MIFRESIEPRDDPLLGYALRPGAPDGRHHRISHAGLRDRDYPRPKPPGVYRIAAIGDSITYGSGVAREAAWPRRLEALLAERRRPGDPRIEVLDLGVPGYNIEQVVERLRVDGLPFDPDAVVYAYVLNDPQGTSVEAEALRTLRDAFDRPTHTGPWRWLAHSHLYLLARQVLFQRDERSILRARPPRDAAYEAAASGDRAGYFRALHTGPEGAARLARGLDALAALAREHRLPVLVALFPLFGRSRGAGPESLADVHALVAQAAAARGFAVLDLLPVFQAASRRFGSDLDVDFLHPDPLGHRVAAAALLDWMCRNAWGPATSIDCTHARAADPTDAAVARVVGDSLGAASSRH